eukprot:TRINITY_DN28067_c0_g2_i1.p4 TRINITY_DN28067_c0_g2~~TRINITY_DN28067_c0_g2_i1.p4  ORF type:complete len:106 (-),score=10.35 TRINITY_DN28067_c0_g2_i1:21-338(-)
MGNQIQKIKRGGIKLQGQKNKNILLEGGEEKKEKIVMGLFEVKIRILFYLFFGLFRLEELHLYVLYTIFTLFGIIIGNWLSQKVSQVLARTKGVTIWALSRRETR